MYSYEKFRAYQWLLDFNAFLLIDMKLVRIFQIRTIINWYVTTVPISWCSWQESQLLSANLLFSSFLGIIHDDIHSEIRQKRNFLCNRSQKFFVLSSEIFKFLETLKLIFVLWRRCGAQCIHAFRWYLILKSIQIHFQEATLHLSHQRLHNLANIPHNHQTQRSSIGIIAVQSTWDSPVTSN